MNHAPTFEVYGHSQATAFGSTDIAFGWPARLASELDAVEWNYAVGGTCLSRHVNGYPNFIREPVRPLRQSGPYIAATPLAITHIGIADLAQLGLAALPTFEQALRAHLAHLSLGAYFDAEPSGGSHASMAFGGTWGDVTETDKNTGAGWRPLVNVGATLTITTPGDFPGGEADIFWIGADVSGVDSGGVIEYEVTGATRVGATRQTIAGWEKGAAATYGRVVTRITGLNPGVNTILVTYRSNTGFGVGLDGWGIRAVAPPALLVCQQPLPTAAAITTWLNGFTKYTEVNQASVKALNDSVQKVGGEFGAQYVSIPDFLLYSPDTHTYDTIHPNDRGAAVIFDAVRDAVKSLPSRAVTTGFEEQPLAPTFQNSWGQNGSGYASAGYTLGEGRLVRLVGRVKRTGSPTPPETIFTLPAAHRPATKVGFLQLGSAGTPTVEIASDGTVRYAAGSLGASGWIDLSGISFYAGR